MVDAGFESGHNIVIMDRKSSALAFRCSFVDFNFYGGPPRIA